VKSEKFAAAQKNSQFSIIYYQFFNYLSPLVKIGGTLEIQRKTSFPLVFRSVCTTFASKEMKYG